MAKPSAHPVQVVKYSSHPSKSKPDLLAVEEPLEIRLGFGPEFDRQQRAISVTMRTPGHDLELALGFLFSEGIITDYSQVLNIHHCKDIGKTEDPENIVRAELHPSVQPELDLLERHFYTTSSCGVCAKSSIDAIRTSHCPELTPGLPKIAESLVHQLPQKLRKAQAVFEHTGGLHAAALFDTSGELLLMREDVGRHNALDKVIGASLLQSKLPLSNCILLVSGRSSFELVQKSLAAGVAIMAAVGAPSSLAVQLASEFGMTLLGFVREGRFNGYSGLDRVESDASLRKKIETSSS